MNANTADINERPALLEEIILFLRKGGYISGEGKHHFIHRCSDFAPDSFVSRSFPVDTRSYLEIALDIATELGCKGLVNTPDVIALVHDIYRKEETEGEKDNTISYQSYWCLLAEIDLAIKFGGEKDVDAAIERLLHFYYRFSCDREEWWRLDTYVIGKCSNTTKERVLAYRLKNNSYTPEIFSLLELIGRKITTAEIWRLIKTDQRKGYHNFEPKEGLEYVEMSREAGNASEKFTMKVLKAFHIV